MNIFTDPTIQSVAANLSPKTKARYKMLGESMYRDIDFEAVCETGAPPFFTETQKRVQSLFKEGLHISLLQAGEKEIMRELEGDEWYIQYGFEKKDLDSM